MATGMRGLVCILAVCIIHVNSQGTNLSFVDEMLGEHQPTKAPDTSSNINRLVTRDEVRVLQEHNVKMTRTVKQIEMALDEQEQRLDRREMMLERLAEARSGINARVNTLKHLSSESDSINMLDINSGIPKLKTMVEEISEQTEDNPRLVNVTHAVELLQDNLTALSEKRLEVERNIQEILKTTDRGKARHLGQLERNREIDALLRPMDAIMKEIQHDLVIIEDPESSMNARYTKVLSRLAHDVELLTRRVDKTSADLPHANVIINGYLEDLHKTRNMGEITRKRIESVLQCNKDLASSYLDLIHTQNETSHNLQGLHDDHSLIGSRLVTLYLGQHKLKQDGDEYAEFIHKMSLTLKSKNLDHPKAKDHMIKKLAYELMGSKSSIRDMAKKIVKIQRRLKAFLEQIRSIRDTKLHVKMGDKGKHH